MNNLILDCSYGMNVYVVSDNNVFSYEDKVQNKHSDEILKIIDELLVKSCLNIKDIDNICVCVGPGSFTGVRVAVSIVKGLAIGCNAKVFTRVRKKRPSKASGKSRTSEGTWSCKRKTEARKEKASWKTND